MRLRREIRDLENERLVREQILKNMNSINRLVRGWEEVANWPSRFCSECRLERNRLPKSGVCVLFCERKRNQNQPPPATRTLQSPEPDRRRLFVFLRPSRIPLCAVLVRLEGRGELRFLRLVRG